MSRGDVKFVSHGSLEHRLEHLSCYLLGKLVFHRLADDILAYIFFLNATIPEHATTVASSQVCYEMAVHCTQLSHDLGPYHWLSIIINILTSGLRHYLIVQVPRCWILALGSTLYTVRLGRMKDGECWSWAGSVEAERWALISNHIARLRTFYLEIEISPNRHLEAWRTGDYVGIGNLMLPDLSSGPPWSTEAVELEQKVDLPVVVEWIQSWPLYYD